MNDPNDRGGETKFGISKKEFPEVDIPNLTVEKAEDIYYAKYYEKIDGNALNVVSPRLMENVFDFGVNSGPKRAVSKLQEVLGLKGPSVNGAMNPETMTAIRDYKEKWGEEDLVESYKAARMRYLKKLEDWKFYGNGWTKRVTGL